MSTDSERITWLESYVDQLNELISPWGDVLRADLLQRESGIGRAAEGPLTPLAAVRRAAQVYGNQRSCLHPNDKQKEIRQTPMGSFTMHTFECQLCGFVHDDD